MSVSVTIKTGARVHFGLIPLSGIGRYAGLGVMIQRPGFDVCAATVMKAAPGSCTDLTELWMPRMRRAAQRIGWGDVNLPPLRIMRQIPSHQGLGSGTQLDLAAAECLTRLRHIRGQGWDSALSPSECWEMLGRGRRSFVGTAGYFSGGLIWDNGSASHPEGVRRSHLPEDWKCLLIKGIGGTEVSGIDEERRFATLRTVDEGIAHRMMHLAEDVLLPAAECGDFNAFASAVEAYGQLAGQIFAPVQGGMYNGPLATRIVQRLKQLNAEGVGQSSWGPTVFAWFNDLDQLHYVSDRIRTEFDPVASLVSQVLNRGRQVEFHYLESQSRDS